MMLLGFPKSTLGSTPDSPHVDPKDLIGMLATTRNPISVLFALLAALIAAALVLALAPSPAGATATTTDSVVTIPLGKSGAGFRAKGVRVSAISPARIVKNELRLKTSDISVTTATSAGVVLRGGLKLKRGKRTLKIQGLLVEARNKKISITGKLGKKRVTVLSGAASVGVVQGVAQQVVAPAISVKLATKARRTFRSSLKLKKTPSAKLGTLVAFVKAELPKSETPTEAVLQDLAGAPLARPGSAVDVGGSSFKWWMRDSWVNYIDFSIPLEPAVGDAPIANSGHVCQDIVPVDKSRQYATNFPFKSGWWDAASQTGYFSYSGSVRWYAIRPGGTVIDITASDPEIEINGAASRLIFTMRDASENTLKRGAFVSLNSSTPLNSVALAPGGGTSRLKSTIFLDPATSPFGSFIGQYTSNPGWGCVDLGFTA